MGIAAQPLYFRSGGADLFAWLHPAVTAVMPAGEAAPVGLVICPPFGYEALCAHLSLRAWAQAAAAAGVPVLRFDYAGTGDSTDADGNDDDDDGAEQLGVWSRCIADAAAQLRRCCAVERIALLGLRLGALAGVLAATEHGGIDALIAITPVTSGRRYLRELRALQGSLAPAASGDSVTASGAAGGAASSAAGRGGGVARAGATALEATGFRLGAQTVARLAGIELASMAPASARAILIIDRNDLPEAARWAHSLRDHGARVQYLALPGYNEMASRPHTALVPQAMIVATTQWLQNLGRQAQERAHERAQEWAPVRPSAERVDERPASVRLRVDGKEVLEQAVFLDAERTLFGLLCEPATGADADAYAYAGDGRGVILLNAGAIHHIGPNRTYVTLARRWAARGYRVLRIDLAGLGDSDARAGRPMNEVYPPGALADVRLAVQFMRERYGDTELTLAGLCSGAYHCLRAGVAGLPVQRLLMINPLTYFWKDGMTLSDTQDAEVLRGPAIYRERMRSGKSWRKLLTGRVPLRPIAHTLMQRARLGLDSARRNLARRLRMHLPDDLGSELQELCARGVSVVFVFARGDPGAALLRTQAGNSIRRLVRRCRVHFIDGADHIFSQSTARARLERLLEQELLAVQAKPMRAAVSGMAQAPGAGDAPQREE